MPERVLINVCGDGHSGTTMLELMLGARADAFSCGEVFAWHRPWRPEHLELDCSCGQRPCPTWERLRETTEGRFHRHVADELQVRRVVDSSKDLRWVADANRWAERADMRALNVVIWKEPAELAYSWWKRGWLGEGPWDPAEGRSLRLLQRNVRTFVRYHAELLATGLPWVAVGHDELTRDPGPTLRALSDACELPYAPGQEAFWEHQHHFVFGSGTVRRSLLRKDALPARRTTLPDDFRAQADELVRIFDGDPDVRWLLRAVRRQAVSA